MDIAKVKIGFTAVLQVLGAVHLAREQQGVALAAFTTAAVSRGGDAVLFQ